MTEKFEVRCRHCRGLVAFASHKQIPGPDNAGYSENITFACVVCQMMIARVLEDLCPKGIAKHNVELGEVVAAYKKAMIGFNEHTTKEHEETKAFYSSWIDLVYSIQSIASGINRMLSESQAKDQ